MDFGVLGFDGSAGAASGSKVPGTKILGSDSELPKKEKPSGTSQDDWRASKIQRTEDFSVLKTMPLHQGSSLLRSNSISRQQEHMISFSSVKPEATPFPSKDGGLVEKCTQNITAFPYYQSVPSGHTRNAGYGNGNLNASLHGTLAGVRGPFTPSQWIELEHQALIYKYITANVPVPSNFLISLKKSLNPYGLSGSSSGSYLPNSLGWGSFCLGYTGSTTDPEPGRCRRTDGKKWRCSRDAVTDQKYCERHINRGRHRSRKPVEGQTGHATTEKTTKSKVVPITASVSASVIASGGASNSLAILPQQFKNVQPGVVNSSAGVIVNRAKDPRGLSMMSSTVNLKTDESTLTIPKQDIPMEESSQPAFEFISSDSLLNPSQRSSYLNARNYESFLNFDCQETQDQHSLCQFTEDWSKDQSSFPVISWPEVLKSDWTRLSMSIPMSSSDFSSSSLSPTQEKFAPSLLRLSREFDPNHTGLGACSKLSESSQKQPNWIPISWGNSMGGPLGEVLSTSTGIADSCKSSSALGLPTEGWEGSPQMVSSPTGVLHKASFRSLSNSSSRSSSRAESKKNNDSGSLCDDVLGSTIVSSNPIPSL